MDYNKNYRGEITPYEDKQICTIQEIFSKESFKTNKAHWIHGFLVKDREAVKKLYELIDFIIEDRKEVFGTIYTQYPEHMTYHNPYHIIPIFEKEFVTINIPETILTRVAIDFKLSSQPNGKRIIVSTGLSNIYEFAGYSDEEEAYSKRTCLYGRFNLPQKKTAAKHIRLKDGKSWVEDGQSYRNQKYYTAWICKSFCKCQFRQYRTAIEIWFLIKTIYPTDEEVRNYRFSHGHCVKSKY